jgi:Tn3 transposase DDE domain
MRPGRRDLRAGRRSTHVDQVAREGRLGQKRPRPPTTWLDRRSRPRWRLLQVALSIKAGTISSAQLLRRLGSYSRRNRLYQAFRELGRVVRTVFLLEYLNDAPLREHITATTNKVEAYNGFAKWLNFGGDGLIDTLDPVEQEKHLKYNHLVANAAAIQNVIDLTRAVRTLQADGYIIQRDDLAQLSPYQTRRLKRFGDYTLSLNQPEPFDTELPMPFPLDEQPETGVVA